MNWRQAYAAMITAVLVSQVSCGSSTGPEGTVETPAVMTWEHPTPRTVVNDIWMVGDSLGFAVGDDGLVVRYDGTSWSREDALTAQSLTSVWASSGDDVYACGYLVLMHFDGTAWTNVLPDGLIRPAVVWGVSPTEVFAGGYWGMWRFDGDAWTEMEIDIEQPINNLHGSSGDDVYASDRRGLDHYDGTAWRPVDGTSEWRVDSIWVNGRDNVLVVHDGMLARYDGVTWDDSLTNPRWGGRLFAPTRDETFAVIGSELQRLDGREWALVHDFADDVGTVRLEAVHGTPTGTLWVGGGYDAGFLECVRGGKVCGEARSATVRKVADVCNAAFGDGAYAAGYSAVLERRADRWYRIDAPFGTYGLRVWSTPQMLYALAAGSVFAYNGREWVRVSDIHDYRVEDIAGGPSDLWAVSTKGVHRIDGLSIDLVVPAQMLQTIAGGPDGDALALGWTSRRELIIARREDYEWTVDTSLEQFKPVEVVTDGRDGFLAGGQQLKADGHWTAAVWHVDEQGWVDVSPPDVSAIYAFGGNQEVGYLLASSGGVVYHYYNGVWTPLDSPFKHPAYRISRSPGPAVYLVGEDAGIVRFGPPR